MSAAISRIDSAINMVFRFKSVGGPADSRFLVRKAAGLKLKVYLISFMKLKIRLGVAVQ